MPPPPPNLGSLEHALRQVRERAETSRRTALTSQGTFANESDYETADVVDAAFASFVDALESHQEFPTIGDPHPDLQILTSVVASLKTGFNMLLRTQGLKSISAVIVDDVEILMRGLTNTYDGRYASIDVDAVRVASVDQVIAPNQQTVVIQVPANAKFVNSVHANGVKLSRNVDFTVERRDETEVEIKLVGRVPVQLNIEAKFTLNDSYGDYWNE
jgi:hypothetical protein